MMVIMYSAAWLLVCVQVLQTNMDTFLLWHHAITLVVEVLNLVQMLELLWGQIQPLHGQEMIYK